MDYLAVSHTDSNTDAHESCQLSSIERIAVAEKYCKSLSALQKRTSMGSFFKKYDLSIAGTEFSLDFIDKFRSDLDSKGLLSFSGSERTGAVIFSILLFGSDYIREAIIVWPVVNNIEIGSGYEDFPKFDNCIDTSTIDTETESVARILYESIFVANKARGLSKEDKQELCNFYDSLIDDPDYKWFGVVGFREYYSDKINFVSYIPDMLKRLGFSSLKAKSEEVNFRFFPAEDVDLLGRDPFLLNEIEVINTEYERVSKRLEVNCEGGSYWFKRLTAITHADPLKMLECVDWLCSEIFEKNNFSQNYKLAILRKAHDLIGLKNDIDQDSFITLMSVMTEDNFRKIYLESKDPRRFLCQTELFILRWQKHDVKFPIYTLKKEASEVGITDIYNMEPDTISDTFGDSSIVEMFSYSPKSSYSLIRKLAKNSYLVDVVNSQISKLSEVDSLSGSSPLRVFGYYARLHRKLCGKPIFKNEKRVLEKLRKETARSNLLSNSEIDCERRERSKRKMWQIVAKARSNFFESLQEKHYVDAVKRITGIVRDRVVLSKELKNAISIYDELQSNSKEEKYLANVPVPIKYLCSFLKRVISSGVRGDTLLLTSDKRNQTFVKKLISNDINPVPWVNGFSREYEMRALGETAIKRRVAFHSNIIDVLCAENNLDVAEIYSDFDRAREKVRDPNLVRNLRVQLQAINKLKNTSKSEEFAQNVTINLETVPLRRLLLGVEVDFSCYGPGGTDLWNAVAVAMNLNIGVAWATIEGGNIIGRKIYTVNDNFELNQYETYTKGHWDLEDSFDKFACDLSKAMRIELSDIGSTTPITTSHWYADEGTLPFFADFRSN